LGSGVEWRGVRSLVPVGVGVWCQVERSEESGASWNWGLGSSEEERSLELESGTYQLELRIEGV